MKRLSILFSAVAVLMTSVLFSCDKERNSLYRDYSGRTISLTGAWGLVEVQYWTAGVTSSEKPVPETLMEFMPDGRGRTLRILPDGGREPVSSFRWEKFPGSVTIYTEEEYENNRCYSDEDPQYMPGRTYEFRVVDENTISSKEKISSGSYLVNIFARF